MVRAPRVEHGLKDNPPAVRPHEPKSERFAQVRDGRWRDDHREGRRNSESPATIDRTLAGKARTARRETPAPKIEADNGQIKHYQADYRLTTAPKLCKGCNVCVTSCPTNTLALDQATKIIVKDPNTCVFCGMCEARCPDFAIWIQRGASDRARVFAKEGAPVL